MDPREDQATIQMDTESRRLVAAIEAAQGLIVVLTGAGISLASGIPTFRGSDPRDAHRSMVHVRAKAEELLPEACGLLTRIA